MTDAMRKANIRAAIWATAISGTGLILELLSRHFLFRGGGFNALDSRVFIFQELAMLLLLPGIMISFVVSALAGVVMHPLAVYHFLRETHPGGDSYFVVWHFGLSGFVPALITWVFYFVVARAYYRGKMKRAERESTSPHS
jgi:hypothetical protein